MKRTFITFSCIIATLFSSLSGTNSTFEGPTTATSSAKLIISNDPILPWFNNANLMSREYNYGGGSGNQLSSVTTSIFMAEAGTITFTSHMRSESESSDSRFLFYIDNIEKYQESDAGVDYIPARTNTFNLSAGYHTLKWTYKPSESCSINIYNIELTGKAKTIDPIAWDGSSKIPIRVNNIYQISSASEFAWFINQVNNGYIALNGILTNDIKINYTGDLDSWRDNPPYYTFPSVTSWHFQGHLNGNGYKIKGLYLGPNSTSLFSKTQGATIQNITFSDAYNSANIIAILVKESNYSTLSNIINRTILTIESESAKAGAIAGTAFSTDIINCKNEGQVNIKNRTLAIGGIVGYAEKCNISNCTNTGKIFSDFETSTGTSSYRGGIAGQIVNNTIISYAQNTGDIESTKIYDPNITGGIVGYVYNNCNLTNSTNHGSLLGTAQKKGGIAGKLKSGIIDNCTNYGNLYSQSELGGITSDAEYSTIKNSANIGTLSSTGSTVGGISGITTDCEILNSYNVSEINTRGHFAGGIIGTSIKYYATSIRNCYNKGTILCTSESQGSIVGNIVGDIILENNYYLVGSSTKNHINTTAVSNEDFENGKLAILLNQGVETTLADPTHLTYNAWGQKIENNGYPVHSQNKRLFFEINSDFTLNYNAEVDDLIINPTSTLKLASNNGLTIVNYLTNNGNFILEDNATLITLGEISGNGKSIAEKNLTGNNSNNGRQWWYISSPVTGATTSLFNPTITYSNKFGYFDETSNPPNYVLLSGEDHILEKGRGYVIQLKTTDKYNFQGSSFNTGNITLFPTRTGNTASQRGFNLIGNPYPSYVNWNSVYQHLNTRNIRPTIWYRTYAGSANTMKFKTYNALLQEGIEGVTGIIPPFQGFWLKVDKDGENGLITFQNSMRSHIKDSSNPMKAPAQENKQKIRMQLSNGINSDEILIVGTNEASDFIDLYDSEKISNNTSEISELFLFVDNEELSINAMNDLINKQIQIGIRPYRSGTFKLSLTEVSSINEDCIIELTDLRNNYKMTITDKSEYNFYSDGMTDNNRFLLEIKKQSITTNNQNVEVNSHSISVNQNNQICIFHPSIETAINSLMITDIFGKLQSFTIERNDTNTLYINHRFSRGIYIVHSEYFTQKIVIN